MPDLPERIRSWLRDETAASEALVSEALALGPLHAYSRFVGGETGARFFPGFTRLTGLGRFGGLDVWLVAVLIPAVVVFLALTAMGSSLNFSPMVEAIVAGVLFAISLVGASVLYLVASKRYQAAVVGQLKGWSRADILWFSALVVVIPAVGFAAVTSVGVHHGFLKADGMPAAISDLPFAAFGLYIWNLADAIPVLEIPDTLLWKPQMTLTTTAGGVLVLSYKVLVILPFVQLIGSALARTFGEPEPTTNAGGGTISPDGPAGGDTAA